MNFTNIPFLKINQFGIINRFCRNFNKSSKIRNVTVHPTQIKSKFLFLKLTTTIIGGIVGYDGIVSDFVYTRAAERFMRSLKVAGLVTINYLLILRQSTDDNYETKLKSVHLKCAQEILNACLINGGLYIKVGQGVAAINHILPEEYTKTLSQLQDKCLPQDKINVENVFRQEFGKLPEEIFAEFNYNPIAAASLAQVFKAKLKTGETVAVKVQYIDLDKRFPSDVGTISFLQDVVEVFFKNYNFSWIVKSIRKNLEQELDFINEGKNAEKCSRDLKKLNFVRVPTIMWDFTTKRILTMEWIDGCKITDLNQLKSLNINLKDLDIKLFTVFSEQIFNTGFVHADPHPGNIFVRSKTSGETELVLLDHGLYDSLSDDVRLCLCEFWEATVLKDESRMQQSAIKLKINAYKHFAEVLFQIPYETSVTIKSKLTDEDIAYMQKVATENFEKVMNTLKEMPRNMLFVIRNLNTIRAISRDHGDPVDRPKVMARYAQKCIYQRNNSIIGYFEWLYRRIRFEYCLMKKSCQISLMNLYIDVLHKLGRSPESSKYLFEKADLSSE